MAFEPQAADSTQRDAEMFLDLQHVSIARGSATVLHDITLQVRRGERIAILGPNGCGKSTLIKTMTCELYPLVQPGTRVEIFGRARWDVQGLGRRLGIGPGEPP